MTEPLTLYDVGEMMGRAEAAQFSSNQAVFTAAANDLLRLAPSWLELHKEVLGVDELLEIAEQLRDSSLQQERLSAHLQRLRLLHVNR